MNSTAPHTTSPCIAFNGQQHIATGSMADVAQAAKRLDDAGKLGPLLVFDARSSTLLELDLRGSQADVAQRYAPAGASAASGDGDGGRGDGGDAASRSANPADPADPGGDTASARPRGRPRLGVVAREVTLLPRHWDWLASQPGGASVALRKLVEDARRVHAGRDAARQARESAYRFMSAIASGEATFEEAARALFADDRPRFEALVSAWPTELRLHLLALAQGSFGAAPSAVAA